MSRADPGPVWITRSQPGAGRQARDLQAAGYQCIVSPVLGIEPLATGPVAARPDIVIFVSEHAVRHGLSRLDPAAVAAARVLAVGARTAAVLAEAGVVADQPGRPDSEGLLALPVLTAVARQHVLLVCGEDGRSLLADTLAARGASVERLVCYHRTQIPGGPQPAGVGVIVVGSAAGLDAIARYWFAAGGAASVPVLVPSARVQNHGVALGFRNVHDCAGADSAAILRALSGLARPSGNE